MFFHIEHTTEYRYSEPATESFSELRLRPRDSLRQKVSRHNTRVEPAVLVESHTDYFGNFVETVSIPFRHPSLVVTSVCDVETKPFNDVLASVQMSVAEARQLHAGQRRELHDFLRTSQIVTFQEGVWKLADEFLSPAAPFSESLRALNTHLFRTLRYRPGATDAGTTVEQFLKVKEGVCQDFAHLMISVCRAAGIPARYVSGYIETDPVLGPDGEPLDTALIGATASHAWLEIFTPQGLWVGFDPTNDCLEGERHVQIGIGRDYADVPPMKGIFQGSNAQSLSVQVRVTRNADTTAPVPAPADADGERSP
jgi:transglutaminase-like putative cysteine protease